MKLSTLALSLSLSAVIIEMESMQDIFEWIHNHSEPNTILLFDIHDTLIRPTGLLDSAQWHRFIFNRAFAETGDRSTAFEEEAQARLLVAPYLGFNCIEQAAIEVLQSLQQDKNLLILGFTACDPRLSSYVCSHLKSCAIDFSSTILNLNSTDFSSNYFIDRGTIFCKFYKPECNKGSVVLDILHDYNLTVANIIFIDNTLHNLHITQDLLEKDRPSIKFVGIHYVHKVAEKDFNLAELYSEINELMVDSTIKAKIFSLHE